MKSNIKEPVIIIGCARSGTTLLFTILSASKDLLSLYRESMEIFNKFYIKKKVEDNIDYFDDELTEHDLNDKYRSYFLEEFHKYTSNSRIFGHLMREYLLKKPYLKPFSNIASNLNVVYKDIVYPEYRIVEKTPRNCFRIPFLKKLFPDAKYIYLTRDGRSNISSLIEGWKRHNKFKRYPELNLPLNIPGGYQKKWCYILPPGWQDYINKSIEQICAFQWIKANQYAIEGLKNIDSKNILRITYEDLTKNTESTIMDICKFANISYCEGLKKFALKPPIVSTPKNEKPKEDKWTKNKELLKNIYSEIEPMMTKLSYSLDESKETARL